MMKIRFRLRSRNHITSSLAHRIGGVSLDGRATLGAAVEGEVDARLGPLQRQGQPRVALPEGTNVERAEGPTEGRGNHISNQKVF